MPTINIYEDEKAWSNFGSDADGWVAVTIPETIIGFQGWRYRWWDRSIEVPFSDWEKI